MRMSSSSSSEKSELAAEPALENGSGTTTAVAALYDRLLAAETGKLSDNNWTIHKRLRFPPAVQIEGVHDSNDWIRRNIDLAPEAHLLDAGCGVGGTLFALLAAQRTGVGITLSRQQVAVAQQEAVRRGVTDRCHFRQQSYDDPLDDTFDFILSLESLAHSRDLTASIDNLSRHLKPGGQFLVLEDMAVGDLSDQGLAQVVQQSWCLQHTYSELHYRTALEGAGLQLSRAVDFTPYVPVKPWPAWLIKFSWQLTQRLPPSRRGSQDIFVGGWALEALYRRRLMKYQLLLAQKV